MDEAGDIYTYISSSSRMDFLSKTGRMHCARFVYSISEFLLILLNKIKDVEEFDVFCHRMGSEIYGRLQYLKTNMLVNFIAENSKFTVFCVKLVWICNCVLLQN